MKTNIIGLIFSTLLFLIFIVLSLVFKSTQYLYIASVCPLLIVPFLPDIRSSQTIRPDKDGSKVRLIQLQGTEAADSDLLVITFEPGYIRWQCGRLYFNPDDIMTYASLPQDELTVTMPVLKFDLLPRLRQKKWVGISLSNLAERTSQLSFTTNEINRLVIRMADLNELLGTRPEGMTHLPSASAASENERSRNSFGA